MVRAPFWRKFATTYERTSGWDLLRVGQLSLVVYSSRAVFSLLLFHLSSPFIHLRVVFLQVLCFFSSLFFAVAHRVGAASCVGFVRRYL